MFGYRRSLGNTTIKPIRRRCSAWRPGEEIERIHLQIFEEALQVRWRSAGDQSCIMEDDRGPLRESETPLEVSHWIFLVNPPSHFTSRKAEDFVAGYLTTGEKLPGEL